MKYSYWVSYQFKTRAGLQGFGAMDIFVTGGPMTAGSIPDVQAEIQRAANMPGASIVIMAISKFES